MRLCQLEFPSHRVDESVAFFAAVLGWKKVPVSIQDQVIFEVPDDSPYGISLRSVTKKADEESVGLLAYFETDRPLTDLTTLIIENGGRIVSEAKAVTGYGQVMIAEDPSGIRLGLYEAQFEGPRRS